MDEIGVDINVSILDLMDCRVKTELSKKGIDTSALVSILDLMDCRVKTHLLI